MDIFDPSIKGDPATLAYALWYDGFATDPDFADTLVNVINGPTIRKALRRIEEDCEGRTLAPSKGGHPPSGGETLRRDSGDYRKVWRMKPDGSTRGYFICSD